MLLFWVTSHRFRPQGRLCEEELRLSEVDYETSYHRVYRIYCSMCRSHCIEYARNRPLVTGQYEVIKES
jgi:hypothetical protein